MSDVVVDVVSAVLMLVGAGFCLLSGIGLVRFPDTVSRLHAASKAQTLGVLLVVLGAVLQTPAGKAPSLLLIALFSLLTAPVTGHIVARIAYRTDAVERRRVVLDELATRLVDERPAEGRRPDDREPPAPR
ncbi:multisubunit sodium/proton antiporter, MrpG subunit [Streptomyces zhaozhouensis]|uniref:Multisubunit sodium/proton antiporter, MrpG subunit n=1 Tax=Streptomyces zhaozhouensis TaxID=1300267 RepID=A0A286E4E9_9ACTN|nr:monovalent cation/H(+) antiporter subunit G [Streptomyces zhaozhouensis]SOD65798.1 multisubunit sodium/proton antiporter, MrpG subunit [Streptomyces zhaozhouensis]